jgi:tRNA 2-thiouridine synthesizing protein D
MKLGILVNEGPFTHQASDSAYQFTKAALEKGHEIVRVFFYHDGVNNANKLSEPQSDDRNLVALWSELAQEHGVELTVCAALKMSCWQRVSKSQVSANWLKRESLVTGLLRSAIRGTM